MSHKNRGEDVHNGHSKNSRKGVHRRRGSSGDPHKIYFGNSTNAGKSCSWCYYKVCSRVRAKTLINAECKFLFFAIKINSVIMILQFPNLLQCLIL